MSYRIFLTLALFSVTAAQAHSIEAADQTSVQSTEITAECSSAAEGLNTIMQNADHGARYKFDSSTIIGRMNIVAYNFAIKNKEDVDRQQFMTQALNNCIIDSTKSATGEIK